jgi:Conjugative transposon, TraM
MKIEKNKIVFASVLLCIVLFISAYSIMLLSGDEEPTIENNQISVPKLKDEQKEYESKLDALNDLKEVRQTNAPSIYDERLLDSTGVYDPDLLDKEKMRIVDSIYNEGRINYTERSYRNTQVKTNIQPRTIQKDTVLKTTNTKDLNNAQKDFFHKAPEVISNIPENTDAIIYTIVNGTQIIKKNYRLELRLAKPALINGQKLPKNTSLYGFISFKPNRTMIHITNIGHQEISLKAFDFQDGNEGIYTVNSFRAEATKAVVDDAIDQINIPSVPSTGVLKNVFQRSNRNTKVTITNNYKLILKPKL